jgi:hypothetical protein
MAKDLEKYGVVPRKSYITYLPQSIDDKMMPHLIRGIFDGDGCIQAKQTDKNNRFLHAFSICGNHQLMEDIVNYCFEHKKMFKIKPKVYDYKDRHLSDFHIQAKDDMDEFGEWIYNNATIYLIRKNNIYQNFKQHYNFN